MIVGILSFQGDYALHKKALDHIGVKNILVNSVSTLNKTNALIIPGGESTVISKFLSYTHLDKKIKEYSLKKNIFGTCAGTIIMSKECDDSKVLNLNILNIKSLRNKWGRQINSFEAQIDINLKNKIKYYAKFIRAPKIKVLSNNVKILSMYRNEPVLVRDHLHLSATFHAEMSSNLDVHKYFIGMINV